MWKYSERFLCNAIVGREVAVEAVVRTYASKYVILKFSNILQENVYVGVSS